MYRIHIDLNKKKWSLQIFFDAGGASEIWSKRGGGS